MKTKSKAVLGLSKLTPEGKVVKSQSFLDNMQSSGNFPNATMPISYTAAQTLVTNLQNATQAAASGNSVDISNMHEEEKLLMLGFNLIKAHVEMVSNTYANPDAIILSAGMTVASNTGGSAVTDLTLDALGGGKVQIRVPRTTADKAFCYQYSTSADPTNWVVIAYNSLSKIVFNGQTPGTILNIRYATIGSAGMGVFCSPKQVVVS